MKRCWTRCTPGVRAWAKNPPHWLEILLPSTAHDALPLNLDRGETEAIHLAEKLHSDWLLMGLQALERKCLPCMSNPSAAEAAILFLIYERAKARSPSKIVLTQTNRRSFDCASRDTTARGSALDDSSWVRRERQKQEQRQDEMRGSLHYGVKARLRSR